MAVPIMYIVFTLVFVFVVSLSLLFLFVCCFFCPSDFNYIYGIKVWKSGNWQFLLSRIKWYLELFLQKCLLSRPLECALFCPNRSI